MVEILIVDDERVVREGLKTLLTGEGYFVRTAKWRVGLCAAKYCIVFKVVKRSACREISQYFTAMKMID